MNGLMMIAVASGLVLVYFIGFGVVHAMGWLHSKLALVALLIAYHLYCKHLLKQFEAGTNKRPHVWYRWFNEVPVMALVVILWLAVVKPF
jgi:putative membrane protein